MFHYAPAQGEGSKKYLSGNEGVPSGRSVYVRVNGEHGAERQVGEGGTRDFEEPEGVVCERAARHTVCAL